MTAPIPMILTCPVCGGRHIDEGEFATTGVQFLPGFKNEPWQ